MPTNVRRAERNFPTYVRYIGLLLVLVGAAAVLLGKPEGSAVVLAGVGLVGYKNVVKANGDGKAKGEEE